jgi:hypothetical protein
MNGNANVIARRPERIVPRALPRRQTSTAPTPPRNWRNPGWLARTLITAAFFALPGILAGAIAGAVLGRFFLSLAIGAMLAACFGAWMERRL